MAHVTIASYSFSLCGYHGIYFNDKLSDENKKNPKTTNLDLVSLTQYPIM